jgi:predicted nucleic acid-binding protein
MRVVVPIPLESNVCRDSDDDMVLATALTGKAVSIITGDKDLLGLKKFGEIDILFPSEFEAYEVNFVPDAE